MSFESGNTLTTSHEESPILNRFDHLAEIMAQEVEADGGWINIPPKTLSVDSEPEQVSFFVFMPRPIAGYESKYDPSIMMEVGDRKYHEDGKPSGKIKQIYVQRSDLEGRDEKQKNAENKFEEIEEGFFAYKNFTVIQKLD